MVASRLRRVEEKMARRRIAMALIGIIALVTFVGLFGLRILVGFSLLVDKLRGSSPQQQQSTIILPPIIEPLPEATNSATLEIHGRATAKNQVIIFINESEYKKVTVPEDGAFTVSDIPVEEGTVMVQAKQMDDKNNVSDLSNAILTVIDRTAPRLTIDAPSDTTIVNDGTHRVTVKGQTDEDVKVTINGRIVVLKADGSFTYNMALNDGENKLEIISRDPAGNETKVERRVMYQP